MYRAVPLQCPGSGSRASVARNLFLCNFPRRGGGRPAPARGSFYAFFLKSGSRRRYLIGMKLLKRLEYAGFPSYLAAFSALERYFDLPAGPVALVETEGSIVDLSRLFENVSFLGTSAYDAVVEKDGEMLLFRCIDEEDVYGGGTLGAAFEYANGPYPRSCDLDFSQAAPDVRDTRAPFGRTFPPPSPRISDIKDAFTLQGSLLYDISRGAFVDRKAVYYSLRDKSLSLPAAGLARKSIPARSGYPVFEAALIAARLGYEPSEELLSALERPDTAPPLSPPAPKGAGAPTRASTGDSSKLSAAEQRFLLTGVLTGKWTGRGLGLLKRSGFIDAHWPLLARMGGVDHAKEQHPEGNVWNHTVETFAYRKLRELPLSLGLLLHDCGKPFTGPKNGNAFDRHAQAGADKAREFLSRLGYDDEVVRKVAYFVRNHMLAAYVPRIPFHRIEDVLASPLFPELLELYRCDVSSTFRGPDGYYEACAAYRQFLKNRRNPFRSADGRKRLKLLVE